MDWRLFFQISGPGGSESRGENASRPAASEWGVPPDDIQLQKIAAHLRRLRRMKQHQIMLADLPAWTESLGCKTEDLVEMLGWLVDTKSELLNDFSLDMHLVDAIVQCRLRREGRFDRREWVGEDAPE